MHRFTFPAILAFLLFFPFGMVLSATLPVSESLQPVTFRGDYGGHTYELNGTAQSVLAQLKALYPEIELPNRGKFGVESRAVLDKKDNFQPPLCIPIGGQPSWGLAGTTNIESCSSDLINLNSRLVMPGGPSECGMICCEKAPGSAAGAQVLLCNDNTYQIDPASPYLASYAMDIIDLCPFNWDANFNQLSGGQEFDSDNYNIVVRGGNC